MSDLPAFDLDAICSRIADLVVERMRDGAPKRYATAADNPIGSKRAFLDASRRGAFPCFKRGREVAAMWEDVQRWVESRPLARHASPDAGAEPGKAG